MDFEKDLDIDVDQTLDFNTDIFYDKDATVDWDIDADTDIDGNIANLNFDVEAFGSNVDTLAEADVFVLAVEDTLSSVGGSMLAAVD